MDEGNDFKHFVKSRTKTFTQSTYTLSEWVLLDSKGGYGVRDEMGTLDTFPRQKFLCKHKVYDIKEYLRFIRFFS